MKHTTVRQAKQDALKKYEDQQEEIKKLLKEIQAGLQQHDRAASKEGGHNWTHVGDLTRITSELKDIRDRLHGKGEYSISY